ncbi:serine/threonine protein kinase [Planktothrix sp. FACHB-1355]|uniref:Serine/threonine protein kinase n=1 Tax=Aerosakkonema funiforme FACHB-1375 TaxID=2949571 RepID=A0A926ZHI4_9CYAN|nr:MULTISPECIES: serine/threonine protein kinase [Oscillatoriales]MBD2182649.1 serine/threonine protein kinase [Aerosakkonema funiforme FACHB-1375]MBD3559361.1 serine/threonine protein kinase [Planktothrix sp. FACHB-1355]
MLFYSVYGLQLHSNGPIPGLVPLQITSEVDVRVWLSCVPPWWEDIPEVLHRVSYVSPYQDECGQPILRVWKIDDRYFRLLYCDRTEFIVDRSGTEIWATWPDNLSLEDTATYLLGPILGFLLRLRGVVCLHASSVQVGDKCIAIVGPAGAGKSTTVAAFAKAGFPILSDDVLPLLARHNSYLVQSAYPRVRLWPKSVEILYGMPDALPCLTPNWDKRYLDLTQAGYEFRHQSLPLGAIYMLGDRITSSAAPFIETVPAHTGLITLVANTYASNLIDKSMRGQEFDLLSRVVTNVPLRRVTPHADPVYLSKLCDLILEDFERLANN